MDGWENLSSVALDIPATEPWRCSSLSLMYVPSKTRAALHAD
jgi:hypothetical protein